MEGPERPGQPGGEGQKGRKPFQPPNSVRHAGAARRRAPEAPERITGAEPDGPVRDSSEPRRSPDANLETPGSASWLASGPCPTATGGGAEASAFATDGGDNRTPEGVSFARSSPCAPRAAIWQADPVGTPDNAGSGPRVPQSSRPRCTTITPGCQAWRHARPAKQDETRTPGAAVVLRDHESARE